MRSQQGAQLLQNNAADYGWVDAPPTCTAFCGPLLLCCNRHPRQKRAFVVERARRERERLVSDPSAPGCGNAIGRTLCFRTRGARSIPNTATLSSTAGPAARVDNVAALYAEVESGSTEHAALRCGPRHAVSVRAVLAHAIIVLWLAFVMYYFILFGT